jgi:hypothetical protein
LLIVSSILLLIINDTPKVEAQLNIQTLKFQNNNFEFTTFSSVENELNNLKQSKITQLEEERRANERQLQIDNVESILARYNSPFVGLGYIIVDQAAACGGDYRIITAIAGNESGFGRIPYKLYNPFGYLDGVQYSGWEEALSSISCKISQRFIAPCAGDLWCIVNKYGGSDTDKPKWVKNITWFMNQV